MVNTILSGTLSFARMSPSFVGLIIVPSSSTRTSCSVSVPPFVSAYSLRDTCSSRQGGTYGSRVGFSPSLFCKSYCLRCISNSARCKRLASRASLTCWNEYLAAMIATTSAAIEMMSPIHAGQSPNPTVTFEMLCEKKATLWAV